MLRQFLISLTPPILMRFQRRILRREPMRLFWHGIYRGFAEVPAHGAGFSGDAWLTEWQARIRHALPKATQSARNDDDDLIYSLGNFLLPLVTALEAERKRPVRILDFGGGMGVGFLGIVRCLPVATNAEFHIVDNAPTCRACAEIYTGHPNLHLHTSLPDQCTEFDVVHSAAVLQYVEDYRKLLEDLIQLKPHHLFLTNLPAGTNPLFASAQVNFSDKSVVPCWFFNLEEMACRLDSLGYQLTYKSTTDRRYDMSNFPESHRVSRYYNLLFTKTTSTSQRT